MKRPSDFLALIVALLALVHLGGGVGEAVAQVITVSGKQ
jgi:hypothetical protein